MTAATNTSNSSDTNLINEFDSLCQAFDGGSFYGLEYILEEVFQPAPTKLSAPVRPPVDWFGLYD